MRGGATDGVRSVLIVKLSAMGDVVHALPVLSFLADALPGARIDWAVETRFAALVDGHPALGRVVAMDLKGWKGRWREARTRAEARRALRLLREGRYDAAVDLQGNLRSGVVRRLSGARLRVGFDRAGARESPNLLFTNRRVPSLPEDRHVTDKLLRVAAGLTGTDIPRPAPPAGIAVSAGDDRFAEETLARLLPGARPLLALHAGTTWTTKRMDPEFWGGAVALLRERIPSLGAALSWGSDAEYAEAREIARIAGPPAAVLPRLGYKPLAAILRRCGAAFGPDAGPVHLAAAAGAKTVTVFRGSDGNYAAPRGPGHRFLQAPQPCTACQIKGEKVCPRDAECRASIPAFSAAQALAELLEGA